MKTSIDNYIKFIDKQIDEEKDLNKLKEEHLIKISFYQHERLIHLLVTLFYAIFMFLSVILAYYNPLSLLIVLILMVFLICYVRHYFYLENHVQYMYKQYDKIVEKIEKKK
jgi:Flp pilus assembly protein TadB